MAGGEELGTRPDAHVLRTLAALNLVPWTIGASGSAFVHGVFSARGVALLDCPRLVRVEDLASGADADLVRAWLRRPRRGELVLEDGWWFGWPGPVALTAGMTDSGFLGAARRIERGRPVEAGETSSRLSGRARLEDDLFRSVIGAVRHGATVALALVGVRQMRAIREGAGHVVADVVLEDVCRRLASAAGPGARIYDYDSDCFALLKVDGDTVSPEDWVERTRAVIETTFRAPFEMDCTSFRLYANAGVAVYPTDHQTVDDVIRGAEVALAHARAAGRENVARANPIWLDRARDDLRLASDMLTSITEHRFRAYAQPIVDLKTGATASAEILMRWQHPEAGPIPPSRFIPVAEGHGLITDLTIELLRSLSRAFRSTPPPAGFRFAVNISPLDLTWLSMGRILEAIEAERLIPFDTLTVELTESAIMEDPTAARSIAEVLRFKGIRIAIDDFGTGYSSFGMLHAMPVDYLKIDRSFITGVETRPERQKLVQAIQAMAGELGLMTVAEGIENEAALAVLRGSGCSLGQGYHFARPMPIERFLSGTR